MNRINNENELMLIIGGFNLTGTIANAFLNAGKFIFTLGQSFGNSIRRIGTKKICQI